MANKFTKSILERQAKEAREHQQAQNNNPTQPQDVSKESPEKLQQTPSAETPKKKIDPPPSSFQLDQILDIEEGRAAKNKTFYLDQAVIDAIHKTAKARCMTDSKLVNEILKKLLL